MDILLVCWDKYCQLTPILVFTNGSHLGVSCGSRHPRLDQGVSSNGRTPQYLTKLLPLNVKLLTSYVHTSIEICQKIAFAKTSISNILLELSPQANSKLRQTLPLTFYKKKKIPHKPRSVTPLRGAHTL